MGEALKIIFNEIPTGENVMGYYPFIGENLWAYKSPNHVSGTLKYQYKQFPQLYF